MPRTSYRVVDKRPSASDGQEVTVDAANPEAAAQMVLGLDLTRAGRPSALVARVYWTNPGQPVSMVRLYARVDDSAL